MTIPQRHLKYQDGERIVCEPEGDQWRAVLTDRDGETIKTGRVWCEIEDAAGDARDMLLDLLESRHDAATAINRSADWEANDQISNGPSCHGAR